MTHKYKSSQLSSVTIVKSQKKNCKIETYLILHLPTFFYCNGPGSVVGIATGYELDGPGIESRWGGGIIRTCPDRPWGPPSFLYYGYRVFPGGKERPGRDADPPSSSAVVMQG